VLQSPAFAASSLCIHTLIEAATAQDWGFHHAHDEVYIVAQDDGGNSPMKLTPLPYSYD
jgi:hypothetical protein